MTNPASRAPALLQGVLARPLASYHLLLVSAGLLLVIGLTMVFSATSVHAYATEQNAFARIAEQASYAAIGLAVFWVCQRLPARSFRALGLPVLLVAFLLQGLLDGLSLLQAGGLLAESRIGPLHADVRWLELGGFSVQPSELAKLALVLWVADILTRKGDRLTRWNELARPLFPVVGLMMLLVGYRDLGTMLCLVVLFIGMLWTAGVRLRMFVGMAVVVLAGIGMLVVAQRSYRLERLTAYLNPDCDVLDECYQAVQGRSAIADGGWFGVGLGNASHKWGWLPEGHNDFIFAVIGEELGVFGSLVVLALFGVFAYTGLRIARRVSDPFRRIAAAGVTTWIAGQAVINIGGVVGLLPITGLPLPFISAGGSALVVSLAAVGMLASFARAEPDAARALHARPPARWVQVLWAPLPPRPPAKSPPAKSSPGKSPRSGASTKGDEGSGMRRAVRDG